MVGEMVRNSSGTVFVKCFPYDESILRYALTYRVGPEAPSVVVVGGQAASRPDAVDLCNRIIGRGSY